MLAFQCENLLVDLEILLAYSTLAVLRDKLSSSTVWSETFGRLSFVRNLHIPSKALVESLLLPDSGHFKWFGCELLRLLVPWQALLLVTTAAISLQRNSRHRVLFPFEVLYWNLLLTLLSAFASRRFSFHMQVHAKIFLLWLKENFLFLILVMELLSWHWRDALELFVRRQTKQLVLETVAILLLCLFFFNREEGGLVVNFRSIDNAPIKKKLVE